MTGNPEPEQARALIRRREHHPRRDRGPATREGHLLDVDDPAVILHFEVDGAAGEAVLLERHFDLDRRTRENAARSDHPRHLDVPVELRPPEPDRVDRCSGRTKVEKRVAQFRRRRVGAIRKEDQPRQRQTGKFVRGSRQGSADPAVRTGEAKLFRRFDPLGPTAEGQQADLEELFEPGKQRAVDPG